MTDFDAGRHAATAYHKRYGQEAVLLRAGEMRRTHGKAEYARGFWQQTNEIAGLGEDFTWSTSAKAERLRNLRPDQPCGHPCEGCGRIAGQWQEELAPAERERRAVRVVIFIEKELEAWWGVDDLLEDNADLSVNQQNTLIVELLQEDISALLDGAKWRIARTEGGRPMTDTEATRQHALFNILVGHCGEMLTPDKVEQIAGELYSETTEGATAWAFSQPADEETNL